MEPEEIIIGTPVIYYSTIMNDGRKLGPFPTVITSEPWEIGGQMCCKVKGKSGAVSIRHLEVDEETNLTAQA